MGVIDDEIIEKYIKAGKIASRVLKNAYKLVKSGKRVLDICEKLENLIVEEGGKPAFPCNISINHEAAHYTPLIGDEKVVPDDAVVKVDIGVHIDGYIADTAITIDLSGKYDDLLNSTEEALMRVYNSLQAGMKLRDIGKIIEETIKARGFKPVKNLSGHNLGYYMIHAGKSIPNYYDPFMPGKIEVGDVVAIEPFATNGAGYVMEGDVKPIVAIKKLRPRHISSEAKKVYEEAYKRFRTLPFTERWLKDVFPDINILRRALKELAHKNIIFEYPVLIEKRGGIVSQFEHTFIVLEKEVIVTTLREN